MKKRVFLTKPELETPPGAELLQLCLDITADGRLDLNEVKTLDRWLRLNKQNETVAAIPYLVDIMKRITASGVIEREEQQELLIALENVIPAAQRGPGQEARKKRVAARKERKRKKREEERERAKHEAKLLREEEWKRAIRIRHFTCCVAGVTFQNDDGSERQDIISWSQPREWLVFEHDQKNRFSDTAIRVLRTNGEQLGHASDEVGAQILDEIGQGRRVFGMITKLLGGTYEKPNRGVVFAVIHAAPDVTDDELIAYVNENIQ